MSDTMIKAGHSRYRAARRLLIFWTVFIGVGAVAGAAMMLIDPSGHIMGMDAMLPYFQVLPFADVLFQDLFFSGNPDRNLVYIKKCIFSGIYGMP